MAHGELAWLFLEPDTGWTTVRETYSRTLEQEPLAAAWMTIEPFSRPRVVPRNKNAVAKKRAAREDVAWDGVETRRRREGSSKNASIHPLTLRGDSIVQSSKKHSCQVS